MAYDQEFHCSRIVPGHFAQLTERLYLQYIGRLRLYKCHVLLLNLMPIKVEAVDHNMPPYSFTYSHSLGAGCVGITLGSGQSGHFYN